MQRAAAMAGDSESPLDLQVFARDVEALRGLGVRLRFTSTAHKRPPGIARTRSISAPAELR